MAPMQAVEDRERAAEHLREQLLAYIERFVEACGGDTRPLNPGHRIPFRWPPHPISYKYHVLASDWTGRASLEAHGETFEVKVARTPHGIFGRSEELWHEARGETLEEMLQNLRDESEVLFQRQLAISEALEQEGRFTGHINDLGPLELVKLLYCRDRDVANEAKTEIETHASLGIFCPTLIQILEDDRHPMRRSAQWCALDLFEDLPSFCSTLDEQKQAIAAMKGLLWNAPDDYARTIYKAGVVLGGHLPNALGGPTLIECLEAPSKIGRRSAIHGLFHVVEWRPEMRDSVVEALRGHARKEKEPVLAEYAALMADDIANACFDHVPEPVFPEEQQ
jgi:hypothetical protein